MSVTLKTYEIGLSFAGEDRGLVEKVYVELSRREISTFYDMNELPSLWGEHAGEVLASIYTKQCQFFMPFISKHYVEKAWPSFEFRRALTRAITLRDRFMLPVRIDDSEFDLLDPGVIYVDSREKSPAEIADIAAGALGRPLGRLEKKKDMKDGEQE